MSLDHIDCAETSSNDSIGPLELLLAWVCLPEKTPTCFLKTDLSAGLNAYFTYTVGRFAPFEGKGKIRERIVNTS